MTHPDTLPVGLVQMTCTEDLNDNLDKCVQGIKETAYNGARLVMLQELHNSRYFCQREDARNFDLAESIPGPSTKVLCRVARESNVVIVASLFEKRSGDIYHNTAVVIEKNGELAGKYRKMHIPDDPGYHEKFYFSDGDLGFKPVQTSVGCLGVMVCWDQWFPEAARLMSLAGAQILLYPSAIGWDRHDSNEEKQRQKDAWRLVQQGHAIANCLPVLCCNRVGFEQGTDSSSAGIDFWGSSFVAGPQGDILAEAPYNKEYVLNTDINLKRSSELRQIWPFLRDRRIDAYKDITLRYRGKD
ncbi:MAG TPA: carbon-nitrogen hydrolase [Gammaproteobacteria bacterium]|nr:carbon-nitrogen hydrolase [Gammaproteobacteria bacterium]